ncbi:polyamine aminopropyltransferase [Ottowia testudinis]|uniref:Polyamine aminopropyltransferase n=1 Tax=Ottowia testudinis TaxID=2816950 RepID=A0A975H4D8_9BURK|nr:polyamine aminopropyltransferase [Ottowia testudinis]QTD46788.1 polyamine aminopropyltransferase [Ottowia testudinis]
MSAPARGDAFAVEQLSPDFGFYLRTTDLLAEARSADQHIEIVQTPLFGRAMRIDGCFMTSEQDEFFYHEPMVHLPAITHGDVRQALIVGGGDGGAAHNLLRYPRLERVVLAELDREVIDMARQWLPAVHRGAFDDPRLELRLGDGRAYIESCEAQFDQIVLDLTDPFGPAVALYTRDFYRLCQRALKPGGVLSLHVQSPIHRGDMMARIVASLRSVFGVVRPYLQYVPLYGTLWGMAMASDRADPLTVSATEVDARLAARGLNGLKLYSGATHHAMLSLPPFVKNLLSAPAAPIDDGDDLDESSLALPAGALCLVEG